MELNVSCCKAVTVAIPRKDITITGQLRHVECSFLGRCPSEALIVLNPVNTEFLDLLCKLVSSAVTAENLFLVKNNWFGLFERWITLSTG